MMTNNKMKKIVKVSLIVAASAIMGGSVYAQKTEVEKEAEDEIKFNIGEDELYNRKREAFALSLIHI